MDAGIWVSKWPRQHTVQGKLDYPAYLEAISTCCGNGEQVEMVASFVNWLQEPKDNVTGTHGLPYYVVVMWPLRST